MKLLFTLLLNISFLFAYSNIIKEKIRYGDSLSKVDPQAAHRYFSDLLEQEQVKVQEQESSEESKQDQAEILCRMAQLDILMGNYPQAVVAFKKASHFFKRIGNEFDLATQLSQLGSAYFFSDFFNHEHALSYFDNAYRLHKNLGLKNTAILDLNFSAYIYWAKGEKEKALAIHQKAMQQFDSLGYTRGLVISTADVGFTLNSLNRYDKALVYNKAALILSKKLKGELVKIPILNNIGVSFLGLNQLDSAYSYSRKSLDLAQEKKLKPRISEALNALHKIQAARGDFQTAYQLHQEYKQNEDSIFHKDALRELIQLENELSQVKKEHATERVLKKTAYFRNVFLISLVGVIIISLMLWRNIFIKSRSKKRLEYKNKKLFELNQLVYEKNDKLNEKNKQITSSIHYAKRLQDAILPTEDALNEGLMNHGVVYLPKDIVSGDFYWIECTDDYVFFAVADCTGHGVPGAMVSVVGHNALNRCIHELKLTDPGEILNHLTKMVEHTFARQNKVSDGMDIVLCVWNKKKIINFAGAFNPLYLIRDGNLSEIKGNKQPIGKYVHHDEFTSHEIQLKKGDSIFLFTDGYADQFGGANNKKMMYSRFKEYLLELNNLSTELMSTKLTERFHAWRGDNEQVDDVCLLNVRF